MANPMFHDWALAKPVHARLPLSTGTGLFVVRRIGEGIFLAPCPGCEEWLNIPISGRTRKLRGAYDDAMYGPLNCIFCETQMKISRDKALVIKLGSPKKRRKVIERKPKPKKGRGSYSASITPEFEEAMRPSVEASKLDMEDGPEVKLSFQRPKLKPEPELDLPVIAEDDTEVVPPDLT